MACGFWGFVVVVVLFLLLLGFLRGCVCVCFVVFPPNKEDLVSKQRPLSVVKLHTC